MVTGDIVLLREFLEAGMLEQTAPPQTDAGAPVATPVRPRWARVAHTPGPAIPTLSASPPPPVRRNGCAHPCLSWPPPAPEAPRSTLAQATVTATNPPAHQAPLSPSDRGRGTGVRGRVCRATCHFHVASVAVASGLEG